MRFPVFRKLWMMYGNNIMHYPPTYIIWQIFINISKLYTYVTVARCFSLIECKIAWMHIVVRSYSYASVKCLESGKLLFQRLFYFYLTSMARCPVVPSTLSSWMNSCKGYICNVCKLWLIIRPGDGNQCCLVFWQCRMENLGHAFL